jgi:ribosomal protein L29
MTKHLKERLADTHDLLAEISLENERFPSAVSDFKSALALKNELFPEESEVIAEAHFKLSLALEFSSNSGDLKEEDGQALRDEAVKELEAALNSTKLKLQNKEVELASSSSPDDNDITREQIAEVKEIVADMENRVSLSLAIPYPVTNMTLAYRVKKSTY